MYYASFNIGFTFVMLEFILLCNPRTEVGELYKLRFPPQEIAL